MAFGQALWEGFGEFENPVGAVLSDKITYEQVKEEAGYDIKYQSPEYDKILLDKSVDAIRKHPIWWSSIVLRRIPKTIALANLIPLTDPKTDVSVINLLSSRDTFVNYVKTYPNVLIAKMTTLMISLGLPLLAVAGIWLRRRDWRKTCLLICVPLYYVLSLSLIHIEPRYILPGTSVFLILTAVTIDWIWGRWKHEASL